ncbi:hypothetical protein [Paenibacillus sp. MMO-177]|uniref:hypothetical protein n=1 Tax=Paenibacillus sp. MMO-177 TaxID=3081289 RepID=UPI003015F582
MTKQMVAELISKISELLILKIDSQIAVEENEDVKRGLEKAKSIVMYLAEE